MLTFLIPSQSILSQILTKDSVTVFVNAIMYYKVIDHNRQDNDQSNNHYDDQFQFSVFNILLIVAHI